MENLLSYFLVSPLHIKGILIFWGICVVLFYSSFVYIIGNVLVSTFKKLLQ